MRTLQFRFFKAREDLRPYLEGVWYGVGLHGNPALPEGALWARLRFRDDRARVSLACQGQFQNLPWQRKERHAPYFWYELGLDLAVRLSADLAHFQAGDLELWLQALEKNRCKLVVKQGTIFFAGVMQKPGFLSFFYQALWFFRRHSAIRSSRRSNT